MKKTLLNHQITLGEVSLKVKNLSNSITFYTDIIGLRLLDQSNNTATLGVDGKPMLKLVEEPTFAYPSKAYTGLFHIALLMPHEKDLGQILYHFSRMNFELDGAGDHLYSQALYMHDPDGHGIEIYADRPKSEWTIHDDGTIDSGTFPVDVERLVNLVDVEFWDGLPTGTIVGHVHLQVKDVDTFRSFYVDRLGFEVTADWRGALFISKNGYHHHLAGNNWARAQEFLPYNVYGLLYYTIIVNNLDEVEGALKDEPTFVKKDNELYVQDGNGITIRFIAQI